MGPIEYGFINVHADLCQLSLRFYAGCLVALQALPYTSVTGLSLQ